MDYIKFVDIIVNELQKYYDEYIIENISFFILSKNKKYIKLLNYIKDYDIILKNNINNIKIIKLYELLTDEKYKIKYFYKNYKFRLIQFFYNIIDHYEGYNFTFNLYKYLLNDEISYYNNDINLIENYKF